MPSSKSNRIAQMCNELGACLSITPKSPTWTSRSPDTALVRGVTSGGRIPRYCSKSRSVPLVFSPAWIIAQKPAIYERRGSYDISASSVSGPIESEKVVQMRSKNSGSITHSHFWATHNECQKQPRIRDPFNIEADKPLANACTTVAICKWPLFFAYDHTGSISIPA